VGVRRRLWAYVGSSAEVLDRTCSSSNDNIEIWPALTARSETSYYIVACLLMIVQLAWPAARCKRHQMLYSRGLLEPWLRPTTDHSVTVYERVDIWAKSETLFSSFLQREVSTFSKLYNIRLVISKIEIIVDCLKIFTHILLRVTIKSG
jgi:hypothetical protein